MFKEVFCVSNRTVAFSAFWCAIAAVIIAGIYIWIGLADSWQTAQDFLWGLFLFCVNVPLAVALCLPSWNLVDDHYEKFHEKRGTEGEVTPVILAFFGAFFSCAIMGLATASWLGFLSGVIIYHLLLILVGLVVLLYRKIDQIPAPPECGNKEQSTD